MCRARVPCTVVLLCIAVYSQECVHSSSGDRIRLALGIFIPEDFSQQLNSSVWTALQHIENESCILNDYVLDPVLKDTKCNTSLGMKALFELMSNKPRPFALFGDGCTNVNEPVAMASKYWQIVHLSYTETHAKFASADSREMYPTFFRIVPGDRTLNKARCKFINEFKWGRVGTVKQSDEPRFAVPHNTLTSSLKHNYGVDVMYTAGITRDEIGNIRAELDELKNLDLHIFVADFEEELASQIMCEVFWKGLYGENYVWILPGYYYNQWWKNATGTNCTVDQLSEAVDGNFAIEFAPYSRRLNDTTVGNKTVEEIKRKIEAPCEGKCEGRIFRAYAYDGLWTLAMAVHSVSTYFQKVNGSTLNFENLNWAAFHARLLDEIEKTSFSGVTGTVRFLNNERLGTVEILQWQNGSYTNMGYYNEADDAFSLNFEIKKWRAPPDATVVVKRRQYVQYTLFMLLSLLAVVGVALALVFLFINIRYRNHRFIKMSSPNMNNLIIGGSVCTYVSVILLGIDTRFVTPEHFVALCYTKTWVLCLGFTLAFGSMFSKTWRVHSIFTNIRMNKKAIKDYKLFLFVGVIALLDMTTLILWAVISPYSYKIAQLSSRHEENVIWEFERCQSHDAIIFQAVLFGIKGLLMILGCFLAWETRHVNVPALNDSKYIGLSVYNVVVMCILGVSLAFILKDRVDEAYALTSFFIIFCTTLTLCLVFVPKVVELIRNPKGSEPRYRKGLMKSVIGHQTKHLARQLSSKVGMSDKDRLRRMEEDNQMWQRFLHEKTDQLWDLSEKLRQLGDFDELIAFSGKGRITPCASHCSSTNERLLLLAASAHDDGSKSMRSAMALERPPATNYYALMQNLTDD